MSERKTSEIKLRVTPSFKAAVQLAAEQAGETMSVYIESASQDRIAADKEVVVQEQRSEATALLTSVIPLHEEWDDYDLGDLSAEVVTELASMGIDFTNWQPQIPAPLNPPVAQNPVPAKDADDSCTKNCHPWEWCECKQLRRD